MMAADEWHKYQESYVRYGIDLTPEAPHERYADRPKQQTKLKASPKERMFILAAIMVVGICLIATVFVQAMASDINYNIYTLNKEISSLSGDIDNLTVTTMSYNNLDEIEYYAQTNLGMVHPDQEQYVYIGDLKGSPEVEAYIAQLTQQERGLAAAADVTPAGAAEHLLA